MFKHLVFFKLQDQAEGASVAENAQKVKELLDGLPALIPQIKQLETGINIKAGDAASHVSLYTVFENEADFNLYKDHPHHLKVVAFIGTVCSERRFVDYED